MSEFRFDKEKHEYWFGEERLLSVTEVLAPLNDYTKIRQDILLHKADLGTEFHSIVSLYLRDDLVEDSIDERLVRPFQAFKTWSMFNRELFQVGLIEHSMYDSRIKVAGTADLILPEDIYEWKLRPYMPATDVIQLAMYDKLAGGNKRRRWVVSFNLDGMFRQHRAESRQAVPMFMMLLNHHRQQKIYDQSLEDWKTLMRE